MDFKELQIQHKAIGYENQQFNELNSGPNASDLQVIDNYSSPRSRQKVSQPLVSNKNSFI